MNKAPEITYSIRVTRSVASADRYDPRDLEQQQHINFTGYGVLRELLDAIEAEAEKLGWLAEDES